MATDWSAFPAVEAAPPPVMSEFPGVVQGRPKPPAQPTPKNPYDIQTDVRDFETDRGDKRFDQTTKLADKFRDLDFVKEYPTVARQYSYALQTQPTPSGDQALIVAYAKMLDPGSVVREAEFDTTAQADSALGRTVSKLQRELGLEGGGRLSEEARDKVRKEMQTLAKQYDAQFQEARDYYSEMATEFGLDPKWVIGTDYSQTYADVVNDYWEDAKAKDPTQAQVYADGIKFGMDGGDDAAFDRGAYLSERYGLNPGDEAKVSAFWNANRGDPGLTPEAVKDWYTRNNIPAPSDADIEAGVEAAQKGASFGSFDTKAAEKEYLGKLDEVIAQRGMDPESASGALEVGIPSGATWGALDEMAGISGAIGGLLRGQNPVDAYGAERDIVRRARDRAYSESPFLTGASEFAGGISTGGLGFRGVDSVRKAARAGALTGAITGFNYGEGAIGSAAGAGVGALTGAIVAPAAQFVGSKVSGALAPKVAAAGPDPRDVIAAGERRAIPVRRPDVDPATRGQRAALLQGDDRARQTIRDAADEDVVAMEEAVGRELGGTGQAADAAMAGQAVQQGALGSIKATRNKASRLYQRAFKASGEARVAPGKAITAIDEQIADLTRNGASQNAASINYLKGLKSDLTGGGPKNTGILDANGNPIIRPPEGLNIESLRASRTGLRERLDKAGVPVTDMTRRMKIVHAAMADDLTAGLRNTPEALADFRQADALWARQAQFRDRVVNQLVGKDADNPIAAKAAADRLKGFVKGDYRRARQLWAEIDDSTKGEVRSFVADSLGRKANGEFSIATFLTNTSGGRGGMVEDRTMRLIFGDEGMRAIKDLRVLAKAKQDAASATNYSNTGGVVKRAAKGLRNLMLGAFGISQFGIGGVALPAAGEFLTRFGERRAARLLTNPDFTKWLRKLPDTADPKAIDRQFARLDSIAARTPSMAADITALKDTLIKAANDNASRLAAEPTGTDGAGNAE